MSSIRWTSPSNIALIKYWGKHGVQLPANPSISFTLSECKTDTEVEFVEKGPGTKVIFEGEERADFVPKVDQLLSRISDHYPFLAEHDLLIRTSNTFPHSSGIASSASAMSALSLCIVTKDAQIKGVDQIDFQEASNIARLGSGSAARSVYGGFTQWGTHPYLADSSDEYAIPLTDIHTDMMEIRDTVLIIEKGSKAVSSSVGHDLMKGHPYADARFDQAQKHVSRMLEILNSGDFDPFAELVELEALTLHAMMMSSTPHFMLMMPGSVAVIRRVMDLRQQGNPMTFTLDAGANVHLLYPSSFEDKALEIIQSEFVDYCQDGLYICDTVGAGPVRIH